MKSGAVFLLIFRIKKILMTIFDQNSFIYFMTKYFLKIIKGKRFFLKFNVANIHKYILGMDIDNKRLQIKMIKIVRLI